MDKKKINWPRYVLQLGVLASLALVLTGLVNYGAKTDPELLCPMGGLQAGATYLVRGSLPCSMSSLQIIMGLTMVAAVMLFGKLFCAYICPIGTIETLIMKGRRAIHLKNLPIRNQSIADKLLRVFKYVLLFVIFYYTVKSSELWCRFVDPYYAAATGLKGEHVVKWVFYTCCGIIVLGGLLVDNFWCRYICPLGALASTFKYYLACVALWLVWVLAGRLVAVTPFMHFSLDAYWWVLLGLFCLMGYLFEILYHRPKFQLLTVCKDDLRCNNCRACVKACPYHIDVASYHGRVNHVDCSLCQECVTNCKHDALHVGVTSKVGRKNIFNYLLPAVLAVALVCAGWWMGKSEKFEIPTISEQWNMNKLPEGAKLEKVMLTELSQIHCFGSSKAFAAKLQQDVQGVYGVKTYARTHRAELMYNPDQITVEEIREKIYVPSVFKCCTPDLQKVPNVKVITIRTEHMTDKNAANLLGLQMEQADSLVYGVATKWGCPLYVYLYVDPAFNHDEAWIKSVVEKPELEFINPKTGLKTGKTKALSYEYVCMEPGVEVIPTTEFLRIVFGDPFVWESAKRIEAAAGKPQYIYEIADESFTKPLIKKNLCFVSNHLSAQDGIMSVKMVLNKNYIPSLQIRFTEPMNADKVWELLTMPVWKITYSKDDVREIESATKIKFLKPGICYPYSE